MMIVKRLFTYCLQKLNFRIIFFTRYPNNMHVLPPFAVPFATAPTFRPALWAPRAVHPTPPCANGHI